MISLERTTTAPAPSPLALSRTDRARTALLVQRKVPAGPEHTRCYEPWFEQADAVRHLAVAGIAVILAQPLAEQLHQLRIVGEFGVVQPVAALLVREIDDDHAEFGEFGRIACSRRRACCRARMPESLSARSSADKQQDERPVRLAVAAHLALEHVDVDVGRGEHDVAELAAEIAVAGDAQAGAAPPSSPRCPSNARRCRCGARRTGRAGAASPRAGRAQRWRFPCRRHSPWSCRPTPRKTAPACRDSRNHGRSAWRGRRRCRRRCCSHG